MVSLRPSRLHHPRADEGSADAPRGGRLASPPSAEGSGGRFHVLLTQDRHHPDEHWTIQLPRLFEPLGIEAHVAHSGAEALHIAAQVRLHAAIVDLATPTGDDRLHRPVDAAPGLWLLDVLRRMEHRPDTIVVNAPLAARQAQRLLNEALRLGAFSVVNRPVQLQTLLAVIQRLIERRYQNHWPPRK